jgi:acyl-coenzyme A synthetase/AMP-(fatty) acid ligase
VIIFTSGSTGTPVAHTKRFGQLVEAAQATRSRLPQAADGRGYALLGTLPAQHMFGLEATVLLPLQTPGVLCAEQPFFPADIAAALGRLPRPRALVSTPVHLRALLDAGVALPPVDLVMCATALLPESLARELEARLAAPLLEIYGSTETGMIATRRAAHERPWQLFPNVRLQRMQGSWYAQGGHVPVAMALSDELEALDEEHFLLHGRTADLVKVAGKRSSLSHLSQQLLSIPGVLDGAFFLHEVAHGSISGVTRLAAVVVAPGLSPARIKTALRERVDAVFLPRPLWLVDELPRTASGKLPREALRTLAVRLASQRARTPR